MKNKIIRNIWYAGVKSSKAFRKNIRQKSKFKIVFFLECRRMHLRQDPHLKRCAGCKRRDRYKMFILTDDPDILLNFLPDDIAKDTPFFILVVGEGPGKLGDDHPRKNRQGNELRVGMFERSSGSFSEIFKNYNVSP